MASQMQENGIRYPQSTESGHLQHMSQSQSILYFLINVGYLLSTQLLIIKFICPDFVGRHTLPPNPSTIPINQSVSLPSNETNNLTQVNPNLPQSIYQPRMPPMTGGTINSPLPISSSVNTMHQQIPAQTQPVIITGPQQPPIPNMSLQHSLPTGQQMIINQHQHQQPIMGQMPTMSYGAPLHMGQYGAQQMPSHQINPQPSAPNQVEQSKVEQPQVAELISFD